MPKNDENAWQIADLVDLEYFLAQDADLDEAVLARRDRELYRSRLSDGPSSRRELLRRWLDLRREEVRSESSAPLPGDVAASLLRPLPKILFAVGALAGAGLAWGVLSYSGDLPINLIAAFALLVVLPFFSAVLSALLPGVHLVRRGQYSGLFAGWLSGVLLTRLCRRLYALGGGESGRNPMALAQSWGILRGRSGLYSGVIGWFAFRLAQLAGLGFSLAVFLSVLLRGVTADLAFSWQTTAKFSAEQVHSLVSTLALPWTGLADPPLSHPTLEQVQGSRVFLKEGLQHLSNADLQSWWYFLMWAILVYAVVPRLVLLGTAAWGLRRAWRRMSFHDARTEALIRRLQLPQLRVGKDDDVAQERRVEMRLPDELRDGATRLRALVPRELFDPEHDMARWQSALEREFHASIEALAPVALDEDEDAEVLQPLANGANPMDGDVLLVLEGWQPCITATLEYLKALRRLMGKDRLLIVALVGRGDREGGRAPTPDHEFGIWRSRLAALSDPALLVHNWKGTADE